jgi:hypothetical protein
MKAKSCIHLRIAKSAGFDVRKYIAAIIRDPMSTHYDKSSRGPIVL